MQLLRNNGEVIRILKEEGDKIFVIDCNKCCMPVWRDKADVAEYAECTEEEMHRLTEVKLVSIDKHDATSRHKAYERYNLIVGILPFITNEGMRSSLITQVSEEKAVSKQSIRKYLCMYLAYQDIAILAPKQCVVDKPLSDMEKVMRWSLNRFYYTSSKHSLKTAYTLMLQHKYCDEKGQLLETFPTFNQFRYFFRKTKNMQKYYTTRTGIKNYERNHRPLLGDRVQQLATGVGVVAMLDSTILDLFLVSDGKLIGRPVLTIAVDGFSSMICGYHLGLTTSTQSIRGLLLNIVSDKVELCKKHGILIKKEEWDCCKMPGTLLTDMGKEYISSTIEQLTELSVHLTALPPYRPDLKGNCERAFGCIQNYICSTLLGHKGNNMHGKYGVIEEDFQERGARDYRLDACLSMSQVEKMLLYAILFFNNSRIIENYPYTPEMLRDKVRPYASDIWAWGKKQLGSNLLQINKKDLVFTLLPRTTGRFDRTGLKVNKMRYFREGYTESYLSSKSVIVAYNPENVSSVWLIESLGQYIEFKLIEKRFAGKSLDEVNELNRQKKAIIKKEEKENLQARITLAEHIQAIANNAKGYDDVQIEHVRENRRSEERRRRIDFVREVLEDE